MRKKIWLIRGLKILSLLVALLLLVSALQTYLFLPDKRDPLRIEGFRLEEKNSLDVVLLGSSEAYADYSAAYAYELYGFTSYPYAVASGPVTLWKVMLDDILTRQDPQLIVVELSGAVYVDSAELHSNPAIHYVLDDMPLCASKIEAINKLCNEDTDPPSCFYFPMTKYHSTWQDFQTLETNFTNMRSLRGRGHALLRGVSTNSAVSLPNNGVRDVKNDYTTVELADEAELALRDFAAYCREKDLNVLFVRFPHRMGLSESDKNYEGFCMANRMAQIVEEYGYPFLCLERETDEIGIDPETDYYNNNHLNIYGQRKNTEFFARYLVENCGVVPGDHGERQRAAWEESAEYYELYCRYVESMIERGEKKTVAETAKLVAALDAMKAEQG